MRRSIRTRWAAATVVLVLIAVVTTAVLAARQAAGNTEDAITEALESRDFVFEQLVTYRDVVGGWDDVDQLVDTLALRTGTRIAVTDDRGRTMADSSTETDEDGPLPSVPVGFIDPGIGVVSYASLEDPTEALTLLEPLLVCAEDAGVQVLFDGEAFQVAQGAEARSCVAAHVDDVLRAGGPLVVRLSNDADPAPHLEEEIIDCLEDAGVEYVLVEDEFGSPFPEPIGDEALTDPALVDCFESAAAFEIREDLLGFADEAFVYMDVDGADPLAVAADPFDPAVAITVGLVAAAAALAAWYAATRLVRPIGVLTAAAADMGAGDLERRVELDRDDELGELGRAFDKMADDIEENDRQRRRMTSDIAHELRTPLANVRGYLEATQDGVVPLDEDLVDTVLEEAIHLQHLVDDLQTLSLVESRRLAIADDIVDLAAVVESVVAANRARASTASVELTLGDLVPDQVRGDGPRIRQVFTNLLENALRYTPSGGAVSVDMSSRPGVVAVSVLDTGPGIAPQDAARVFDRFHRTDAARTRHDGGSGLGLAISMELAVAMGGSIELTSAVGQGSVFTLELRPAEA